MSPTHQDLSNFTTFSQIQILCPCPFKQIKPIISGGSTDLGFQAILCNLMSLSLQRQSGHIGMNMNMNMYVDTLSLLFCPGQAADKAAKKRPMR